MLHTDTQALLRAQDGRRRDVLLISSEHHPETPREQRMLVVQRVAKAHGVTVADIMGRSSCRRCAVPRWHAMAAIRAEFGDSLSMIGRLFGRDHTSVLHGLRKVGAA
jgi:chromosomal replication initiation ATPase DnaA